MLKGGAWPLVTLFQGKLKFKTKYKRRNGTFRCHPGIIVDSLNKIAVKLLLQVDNK